MKKLSVSLAVFPLLMVLAVGFSQNVASAQVSTGSCFSSSERSTYFQQNVVGTGLLPSGLVGTYPLNNIYYATPEAAQKLADCIGNGATVTTLSSGVHNDKYSNPDYLGIQFPNGVVEIAGYLIDRYLANNGTGAYTLEIQALEGMSNANPSAPTVTAGGVPAVSSAANSFNGILSQASQISSMSIPQLLTLLQQLLQLLLNLQIQLLHSNSVANTSGTVSGGGAANAGNGSVNAGGGSVNVGSAVAPIMAQDGYVLSATGSGWQTSLASSKPITAVSLKIDLGSLQAMYGLNIWCNASAGAISSPDEVATSSTYAGSPVVVWLPNCIYSNNGSYNIHVAVTNSNTNAALAQADIPITIGITTAGTGTVAGGATSGTSSPNFYSGAIGGVATSTFRYLAVQSKSIGWMTWNEIEAYDANGNKVQPVNVDVSGDYTSGNTGATGKQALTDGNPNTYWNSGGGLGSSINQFYHVFESWVVLDYGSVKQFSKVRFLHGDQGGGYHDVFVSSDKQNFAQLWSFQCDTTSSGCVPNKWYEYAFQPYGGDPTIALTVNGGASATISDGGIITYGLTASNADYIIPSFSGSSIYFYSNVYNGAICDYHSYRSFINPAPFQGLGGAVDMPTAGWTNTVSGYVSTSSPNPVGQIVTAPGSFAIGPIQQGGCPVDQKFTLTMTAVQSRTGKQATASVDWTLASGVPLISLWYPLNVRDDANNPGQTATYLGISPHQMTMLASSSLHDTYTVVVSSTASFPTTVTLPVHLVRIYDVALPMPTVTVQNNSSLGVTYVPDASPIVSPSNPQADSEIGNLKVALPANFSQSQQFTLKADGVGGTKYTTVIVVTQAYYNSFLSQ
jgi:hypothetical protein